MRRPFFIGAVMFLAIIAVFPIGAHADAAADVAARRAALQGELDQLNIQIATQQQILESKNTQSASLQRDIDIINAQIQKDELSIKARDLNIQSLTEGIGSKNNTLATLDDKFAREQQSLAEILRKTNQLDQTTLVEFIFANKGVSSFFEDVQSFGAIQAALQQSFTAIVDTETATAAAKADLESNRAQQQQLRQDQVIQENQVKADKAQEQTLLATTKAQANQTQSVIQASKKVIAQIQAELFALRDSAAIPFGTALSYADAASQKTGVRSAFILAILKQESDLGQNIGSCFVSNLATGDGVGKNSGTFFQKVMKAPRDTGPFQQITDALGIPWASAPVSCPTSPYYSTNRGYGGAMGPSQFIPSTWQLYQSRLARALGVGMANPWDAKDAIMATALYLSDIGASGGSYTAERNAACKYYSGRSCDTRAPANQFYGDSVMDNTAFFQNQIDIVQGQ